MQDITIRNASLADAPRILEIYAWYVEHTVITFEYDVPSLEEFEGRMRRTMQKYPYLVIERDGRVEGYTYAGPFVGRAAYDWACELTIYLDHDARKHGMGRALYEALADRLQAMGILNLYACIGYPQAEDEYLTRNSARFHEHLGFGRHLPQLRVQVRPLVRHDLDGKDPRRAPPRPAARAALHLLSPTHKQPRTFQQVRGCLFRMKEKIRECQMVLHRRAAALGVQCRAELPVGDCVLPKADECPQQADDPEALQLHDDAVHHAHADGTVGHLGQSTQRHIILE